MPGSDYSRSVQERPVPTPPKQRLSPWVFVLPVLIFGGLGFLVFLHQRQSDAMLDSLNRQHREQFERAIEKGLERAQLQEWDRAAKECAARRSGDLKNGVPNPHCFSCNGKGTAIAVNGESLQCRCCFGEG